MKKIPKKVLCAGSGAAVVWILVVSITLSARNRPLDLVRYATPLTVVSADTSPTDTVRTRDTDSLVPDAPAVERRPQRNSPGSGNDSRPECIAINTAPAAQLDKLPGIGPVMAKRIITWRTEHGNFENSESLLQVKGIGPATLAKMRPLICF